MRAVWPDHKPMSVRVSATDWLDGGSTPEDAVLFAQALKAAGCDIVDVSAGQTVAGARPQYGRLYQTPFSEQLRMEAQVPTITVGNISIPLRNEVIEPYNTLIPSFSAQGLKWLNEQLTFNTASITPLNSVMPPTQRPTKRFC